VVEQRLRVARPYTRSPMLDRRSSHYRCGSRARLPSGLPCETAARVMPMSSTACVTLIIEASADAFARSRSCCGARIRPCSIPGVRRDLARDLIEVGASNPLVDAGVPASAGEPGPSAVRPSATTNEIEEIRNLVWILSLAVLRSTSDCARFANKRSVSVRVGDQSLS
jgi:hypothetical protein